MSIKYYLSYLQQLEAESIHIIRETMAEFAKPVVLYSIGKDSSVLMHLVQKAFYPAKIPFPMLHIDTGYKFQEMISFRDHYAKKNGADLIVYKNESDEAQHLGPDEAHTDHYIYHKKTKPLLEALAKFGFDAAIGGARRDEDKARAKERIFSHRNKFNVWDPKNQRPELWHNYNCQIHKGESMRVFPLSNWTEIDIWRYIKEENIDVVPLYFAKKRKVVSRKGLYLMINEFVQPHDDEEVLDIMCRYRTLGCSPSTGAIPSEATTLDLIIEEMCSFDTSERQTRAIDATSSNAMEKKKRDGYF
ncbi:sulfate adenylyltransferase subunit CysD [Candidatus Peregrinibacteria bacterium CG22_combo_CG10-13_8_21_14_all_44_10]|nr:MAG: sulfate adenylyltransferase small subunit [Candidatus Peregrinibacteria bacterium CG2_30_44_17]PIP66441.1 MAG: sulfate adenylyltransferase subunit CysD [Candidatus Peregrinibacteria bacterium CG22_combo_CG10-13_8_21_14_all_44_10]PIS04468.1 MAG: sulfate adenylyltransferase subunit CysD [Candidatus Peregrinibacteria bacterium CG10_big_fil_rev_8_21_14_0_10_44_7]PJB89466.1 MAG: sulfate adenylyltransferase subunit CysD [Candidatus Peregrinibacteria bacterium CG_4_9_14_0_8_um_filter_44_15]